MRILSFVSLLFACCVSVSTLFAQESAKKATMAISVNDFGEQKNFNAFTDNFKKQTGLVVTARCEHLNLMLFEYDATVYRDQLSLLSFLKQKGFVFEVREGLTVENMTGVCKQTVHNE
jgi:hypothetical protein